MAGDGLKKDARKSRSSREVAMSGAVAHWLMRYREQAILNN